MATDTRLTPTHSAAIGWLAVVSVMMGIFSIVTTEILPIGLLTSIASSFTVSAGTAGLMMTMPGFLAAVSAPVVTIVTARVDRRLMLCACMIVLALANFIAAAAPAYWAMLISRVLVGVVIGSFWSIGAGLAERLVPANQTSRATAVIFSAVPLGSVFGVPVGTMLGNVGGWRLSFVVMGLLSVGVALALGVLLPRLPTAHVTRAEVLRDMIRGAGTRFALLATFAVVLAHFSTYTYVTPFLERVTHASPTLITAFLLAYGVAGVVGNFLAGAAVARRPLAAFGFAGGLIAAATLALPYVGGSGLGAVATLVVWGVGYGAVPVCSQACFTHAAPHAPEAASVLFTASFQATLSAGALTGGVIVDRTSVSTVMSFGAATALAMVAAVVVRSAATAHGRGRR